MSRKKILSISTKGELPLVFDTYAHNFGLIIPLKTGVYWKQQTEGVACHHISIEGVFVPLDKPYAKDIWEKVFHEDSEVSIPDRIAKENYDGDPKEVKRLWEALKAALKQFQGLEFVETVAPKGKPENQEGIQWIKIIKWESSIHGDMRLRGKVVCLVYPNSD